MGRGEARRDEAGWAGRDGRGRTCTARDGRTRCDPGVLTRLDEGQRAKREGPIKKGRGVAERKRRQDERTRERRSRLEAGRLTMIVAINGGRSVRIGMGGKAGDKRGRRERAGRWRPGSRDEVLVTPSTSNVAALQPSGRPRMISLRSSNEVHVVGYSSLSMKLLIESCEPSRGYERSWMSRKRAFEPALGTRPSGDDWKGPIAASSSSRE